MPNISKKSFHILNPRLDPNFKAIFTQNTKASKIALKSFLSAAIGRDVKEATVVQNEDASLYKFQRAVDYDINCEFADGTKAQVEMQGFDQQYDYGKRAEYYAARLVSSVMEVGDDWRWVIQGQIEGKKRDYTSGLLAAERRGLAQGLEQGIKEGLEKGMRQKATETAKKLLAEGIAPEMIAKCCSLSIEEVKVLQKTPLATP